MLAAVRTVADLAREVAPKTEAGRALAPELLAAIRDAGLFGLGGSACAGRCRG